MKRPELSPPPPLPPRAWLIVALLWFTVFSNYLARTLFTTMHGSLVGAIPMSEGQFGLLTSALLWTYGLMSPFAGFLADRFKRSQVIIVSMILWSAMTWLTSYVRTFPQLVFLRSLMGLSEACYMPAALALVADYHRGPTRSLATAIHHTGYVSGMALSGLGGWLAAQRTWHYPFAVVGLASLAYAVPLALLLRDVPPDSAAAMAPGEAKPGVKLGPALASLLSRGYFILMLVVHGLLNLSGWAVIGWAPVFLQEHFHLSQAAAGFSATGYSNGAAVVGLFIGGLWADRWCRRNGRARMFVPAIGLLICIPSILLFANASVFAFAMLGLVFSSMAGAFYDPNTMPVLCEVVDPRYRATGYGLLNLSGNVAAGLGIYLSGVMRDWHIDLHLVFDFGAVLCLICAVIYDGINPRRLPRRAPPVASPSA